MSDDIGDLLAIMARLRAADGCPWDREQTWATIAPYTIEEAYEVADAILRGDIDGLRDELGDLLLQVVYHARLAEEAGHFAFAQVVAGICAKMIRRHPHVFGDAAVADSAAQSRAWERLKAAERLSANADESTAAAAAAAPSPPASVLDAIPATLPALQRALKLQRRATRLGFDWPDAAGPLAKCEEEIGELAAALATAAGGERQPAIVDELGDLLFSAVNLARKLDIDPELALRHANAKFEARFRAMEAIVASEHEGDAAPPLDRLEEIWQRIKNRG